MRATASATVVGPAAVLGEVLARGLLVVAVLVALGAVAEQHVEQQDGEAGADEHRPAVPAEVVVDDEQDDEPGDDEQRRGGT